MTMRVALVGNPNVGKTSLFNRLTGLHQHVANWPGTTVEYASGDFKRGEDSLLVTDLPGVYGLSAFAEDEQVARRFLLHTAPDVVVLVLDAASLERSLFLALETLELYPRAVVALNKMDVAWSEGIDVDAAALSVRLGVPVVPIVAHRGDGVDQLIQTILAVGRAPAAVAPLAVPYGTVVEEAVARVAGQMEAEASLTTPGRWTALRLLQGDTEVLERVRSLPAGQGVLATVASCCGSGEGTFATEQGSARDAAFYLDGYAPRQAEFALDVADAKYSWIREAVAACVRQRAQRRADWTDRLDVAALHSFWGPIIMALIFGTVFWTSFEASAPLSDAVAGAVEWLGEQSTSFLGASGAPDWLSSLLIDGVLAGIGAVLSFVPYMAIFFAVMALLEASGYMARAALLGDRLMQVFGLHGKSLFSLVSAFGCNVPALSATRGMENRSDRLVTGLVVPFVPCNARLGVMAIMVAAFFQAGMAGLAMLALIALSLVVVAVVALAYRRTALPADPSPLLLELPRYARPRWQDVALPAFHHCYLFVSRIWRFLVPATIVVWALTAFPVGAAPEDSYAATLGGWLALVGQPLHFEWQLMVAILFGFVAKETTLSTLGVLYGLTGDAPLAAALGSAMTPLVAFSFLVVYMLYVPCLATVVQLRREVGSWRWVAAGVAVNVAVAFALGLLVQQLGVLLGLAL